MSFTQKYLKYKSKYLKLKGGAAAAADDGSQQIKITQDEQVLFDKLTECAKANGVVLRVAGGWVRDKILGLLNDDIDIVIDNKSGREFSIILCAYINGLQNNWSCELAKSSKDSEANALETATLTIKLPNDVKFELDFVRLRKEVYTESSRIPIIMPASAKEDAERRDLTINSLFYNIDTQLIEDYIGGVKDLRQQIIRTPLDPEKTLCDDPLRMLRALRFLSRFKFTLDDGIKRVMAGPKFKAAFKAKAIAKEVISKEIEGFFKNSRDPLLAFNEIYHSGLWNEIFGGEDEWGKDSFKILQNLKLPAAIEVQSAAAIEGDKKPKINVPMLTVLSALTLPLAIKDKISPPAKKAKTRVEIFYTEKIMIGTLSKKSNIIHECILSILKEDSRLWKRSTIGMIIYKAADCFDIALNIINAYDEQLHAKLYHFITENKLTSEYVKEVIDSINGNIFKDGQFKVDFRNIGKILEHMRINALDNPEKLKNKLIEEAISILMNP